jgi:hypothetical protein
MQITQAPTSGYLPPAPRRVRVYPGVSRGEYWFGRIFILPHTIIGICAFGYLLFLLMWLVFGTDIPGVVTGAEAEPYSKGVHYTVKYTYQLGNETKTGSEGVSQEVYERFHRQEKDKPGVTVHYFALGSHEHRGLREGGSLWGEVWRIALWAGFWNMIMSLALYQLWVKPLRLRWLYKHGEATPGTLVAKREKSGRSTTYYMTYSFRVDETGELRQVESEAGNVAMWKMIPIGHAVTVLYARDNPKRSTVYELGGYGVLGE